MQRGATPAGLPPLSVLDLAFVEAGGTAQAALAGVAAAAARVEALGYHRLWVAEHHAAKSIASVAPSVLLAHLAMSTTRIRLGSGGVMLPNHSPLAVAEQFATLASLHPGRIDLGVGRGPGSTDAVAIRSLRRSDEPVTDDSYRSEIETLLTYLAGEGPSFLLAGAGEPAEPWLLSSSVAGSRLAGELGLPVAFAYHIRPDNALEALTRYRDAFRPSRWSDRPRVLLSVETICAATEAEADILGRPATVFMAAVPREGGEAVLLTPAKAAEVSLPPEAEDAMIQRRATQAHGTPDSVRARLADLAKAYEPDELMLQTPIYHAGRRAHSYELIMDEGVDRTHVG